MRQLQWVFARLADKVGWASGLAWLLLIMICAIIYYLFLPAQQRLSAAEQQLSDMPETEHIVSVYQSPSAQFFAHVPQVNDVAPSIQAIFDEAKQHNIAINEVIYKDEQKAGDMVSRYTMSFSVNGSYPVVKSFVIDGLAKLPYMALEQLSFEREDVGSNIVSTRLRFTLYLVR